VIGVFLLTAQGIGGELEPLVAFYPKAAQSLAATFLSENSNVAKILPDATGKTSWSCWLICRNRTDAFSKIAILQWFFVAGR
jgi:hypothetical protein